MLGRAGDLINIFPVLRAKAYEAGAAIPIVSTMEFYRLFRGVSYLRPDLIDITADRIGVGRDYAYKRYPVVRSIQVWGDNRRQSNVTPRYNMESWHMAGAQHRFNDRSFRPVFDARNFREEERWVEPHLNDKPILLLSVEGGYSSPFRNSQLVKQPIIDTLGESYQIVDLNSFRARSIQDLLGLMEAATVMVLSDTAPLHLAAATSTPVVALLSDRGTWNQTKPRCLAIWAGDYTVAQHDVHKIIGAIRKVPPKIPANILPMMVHAVEQHKEGGEEAARNRTARRSWWDWYQTGRVTSAHLWEPYRRSGRCVGDRRPTPFLKEVFLHALNQARPCDVIVWTNADTIVKPEVTNLIWQGLAVSPVVTQRRVDYATRKPYWGRDLWACRASWLKDNWAEIPDFLLGTPEFDNWMALFARRINGIDSSARELLYDRYPADIPAGPLLHIQHESFSLADERRYTAPENLYNLRLLRDWCRVHQPRVKFGGDGHVDWKV